MPPKRNRVQGGNARSRASAVPQGDVQRRASPESEGETDQPAATHIRGVEAWRPQWTMSSSVEDILLEGSTNRTEMRLNDFLRSNLGGRGVVDTNENVALEMFVLRPTMFINDNEILGLITASPSYQALEAINKLHHEGVFSLEQWTDYEGKDTVTPHAKGKLKAALTEVQKKEKARREEEEKARREADERAKREEERLRHEAEERQRRAREMKYTMSTNIEEVVFKGRVRVKEMRLNDFLLMRFGGKGVVDTNRNVLLEDFFKEPARYILDEGVLNEIRASGAYARMERTVREEMDLEEAVRSLCENGVDFLEQWRDYEGKDTVTPLARRNLKRALTQVLREERREEVERARREGQVGFTLTTTIEGVLFKGRARVIDIKLNDFLTMELDGRGILYANRNVLLRDFFKEPASHIRDAEVLNEIQKKYYALKLESTVREEMELEEDVHQLQEKGVDNLFGWSRAAAEVKASVRDKIKNSLDTAFEVARDLTTKIEAIKMEGLYESVHNARWHHVVEVPGGEGTVMKVKEGKPKQSWTYKEDGNTLEKDDGVEQSGEAPPVLMVLASDKGWPYTLNGLHGAGNDLCVNCEVERVWQIVLDDLTNWFSNFDLILNRSPLPRVLIGTPGIGKSMNAGSYLLYQLLHYDLEKLQVVAYCFGETMYMFDKTTKTVTKYEGNEISKSVLGGLWQCGMKGYIIYDVAKKETPPDTNFAPSTGWGMIVVSSPKLANYDEWEKQAKAKRIIMNCPDEMDVKAMCAWMKRGLDKDEQAGYWKEVEKRMEKVGPIPRHIFDAGEYIVRLGAVGAALVAIKDADVGEYFTLGGEEKKWYSEDPSHKLVKIVRARTDEGAEVFLNASISADVGLQLADRLAKKMATKDILLLILGSHGALASRALEKLGLRAFMYGELVIAIVEGLRELPPPSPSKPQDSVLKVNHQGYPTRTVGLGKLENGVERIPMEYGVLYIPADEKFPLVDGFFFVNSPRKTLVGLQMTTAIAHHTKTSTVNLFTEHLAAYFNGWEELSRDIPWEMIYIQHAFSKKITKWQKCNCFNPGNKTDAEKEIVAFWNGKVHQYHFVLTTDFVNKIREMGAQ